MIRSAPANPGYHLATLHNGRCGFACSLPVLGRDAGAHEGQANLIKAHQRDGKAAPPFLLKLRQHGLLRHHHVALAPAALDYSNGQHACLQFPSQAHRIGDQDARCSSDKLVWQFAFVGNFQGDSCRTESSRDQRPDQQLPCLTLRTVRVASASLVCSTSLLRRRFSRSLCKAVSTGIELCPTLTNHLVVLRAGLRTHLIVNRRLPNDFKQFVQSVTYFFRKDPLTFTNVASEAAARTDCGVAHT